MACKTYQPHRCGECSYINHEAYRGAGKKVCYQLRRVNDQKVAVEVSERQKACNNFRATSRNSRAG